MNFTCYAHGGSAPLRSTQRANGPSTRAAPATARRTCLPTLASGSSRAAGFFCFGCEERRGVVLLTDAPGRRDGRDRRRRRHGNSGELARSLAWLVATKGGCTTPKSEATERRNERASERASEQTSERPLASIGRPPPTPLLPPHSTVDANSCADTQQLFVSTTTSSHSRRERRGNMSREGGSRTSVVCGVVSPPKSTVPRIVPTPSTRVPMGTDRNPEPPAQHVRLSELQ